MDIKIKKLRKKVDTIDSKLISLLSGRFKATKEIQSLKKKAGLSLRDSSREDNIIKEAVKLSKNLKLDNNFIVDIFKKILKESKK